MFIRDILYPLRMMRNVADGLHDWNVFLHLYSIHRKLPIPMMSIETGLPDLSMKDQPVLSQGRPIMYSSIGGESDICTLCVEYMPPPPPWSTPSVAAGCDLEQVSNCGTPACIMAPVNWKLEELPIQEDHVHLGDKGAFRESGIPPKDVSEPVKQIAIGKRKPSQIASPTPLRQVSSSSDIILGRGECEGKEHSSGASTDATNEGDAPHEILASPTRMRRFTFSRRSTPQSLFHKSTPPFSIMRFAMSNISCTPARLQSSSINSGRSKSRPVLHGRQISLPSQASLMSDALGRPKFATWSGSYDTGRKTTCPHNDEAYPSPDAIRILEHVCRECEKGDASELEGESAEMAVMSHFSDSSEDEEEEEGNSSWRPPIKRRLRGRLSNLFYRP